MKEYNNNMAPELAAMCVKIADGKFAENVCCINVTGKTTVADYFVICTVNSEPQLRALAAQLEKDLKETYGLFNKCRDSRSASGWMLLDFGDVLVHVMTPEMRDRYSLENLWGGSPDEKTVQKMVELSER